MATEEVAEFGASPQTHSTDRSAEARRIPRTETEAWVDGSVAGVSGAAVVALFFLVVDFAEGVPMRTPGLLGSALFLRESVAPGATPSTAAAFGYTLMHGVLFVGAGVVAAYTLLGRSQPLGPLSGLGVAAALFAGMEGFFMAGLFVAAPDLISQFGVGRIATANLLAAGAMSAALLRRHHPVGPLFGKSVTLGMVLGLAFLLVLLVFYCSSAYVALEQ